MASGFLRRSLYSITNFSEERCTPGYVASSTFGFPLSWTHCVIWSASGGWWKEHRSQETGSESWSGTYFLCGLELFTSEMLFSVYKMRVIISTYRVVVRIKCKHGFRL